MSKKFVHEADLHMHSNFSDGRNSVERLILDAKEKNVKTLVLTDHDTVDGVPLFMKTCEKNGIDCLTGVEISSTNEYYGQTLDILGYGFNLKDFEVECSALVRHNIEVRRKWLAKTLELYKKNKVMDYSLKKLQKHFKLPAKVSNKYWVLAARVEQFDKSGFKTPNRPIDFARNELKKMASITSLKMIIFQQKRQLKEYENVADWLSGLIRPKLLKRLVS